MGDAPAINNTKRDNRNLQTHLTRLAAIGIALSAEHDLPVLLEKIVDEARSLANADAGTLYLVDDRELNLEFAIIQNRTMETRMGGSAGPITWPPVPLYLDGRPNHANVSTHAALSGEIINIPDVYRAKGFDFSGTRKFDQGTGYRSRSMLVIPMRNKAGETIGVLQLINSLGEGDRPVPFPPEDEDFIASLASQAAVAITNVRLYQDLENLLDAFIKTIAAAIDEKSPYTAGHIRRVQTLTMDIARAMNDDRGVFKDFKLDEDEMRELSIAAWLHDVGKIVTPEHVVDKGTKLETVFDRIELIRSRYEIYRRDLKIKALERALAQKENSTGSMEELASQLAEVEAEEEFIGQCNQPGEFMDDDKIARLQSIAGKSRPGVTGDGPWLSEDELNNLSIRKGSLTDGERAIIENHATVTHKMLKELPFPKKLRRVPNYAAAHHEKLDGSGYPFGLKGEDIPYPARIIAVADIFEALTAPDRPYKKPMPLSESLKILEFMKKDGHIDPDIFELFRRQKVYREYARRELTPGQQDA